MQLGQHRLSQRLDLVEITFGDLQSMQLLNKLCAAHRGVQAFATSKRHLRALEVIRRVYNFKNRSATPLALQLLCNSELINSHLLQWFTAIAGAEVVHVDEAPPARYIGDFFLFGRCPELWHQPARSPAFMHFEGIRVPCKLGHAALAAQGDARCLMVALEALSTVRHSISCQFGLALMLATAERQHSLIFSRRGHQSQAHLQEAVMQPRPTGKGCVGFLNLMCKRVLALTADGLVQHHTSCPTAPAGYRPVALRLWGEPFARKTLKILLSQQQDASRCCLQQPHQAFCSVRLGMSQVQQRHQWRQWLTAHLTCLPQGRHPATRPAALMRAAALIFDEAVGQAWLEANIDRYQIACQPAHQRDLKDTT